MTSSRLQLIFQHYVKLGVKTCVVSNVRGFDPLVLCGTIAFPLGDL